MTKEEKQKAIDALKMSAPVMAMTQEQFSDYIQTINQVMDWLEQRPSVDCVSREQVLEETQKWRDTEFLRTTNSYHYLEKRISNLPPVIPKGVTVTDFADKCKECGKIRGTFEDCVSRQAVLDLMQLKMGGKELYKAVYDLPPVTPTHGTCKDCTHWKDSDGVYRRGVGAESKCPINIKEVYEGNFYCKDFDGRD